MHLELLRERTDGVGEAGPGDSHGAEGSFARGVWWLGTGALNAVKLQRSGAGDAIGGRALFGSLHGPRLLELLKSAGG